MYKCEINIVDLDTNEVAFMCSLEELDEKQRTLIQNFAKTILDEHTEES